MRIWMPSPTLGLLEKLKEIKKATQTIKELASKSCFGLKWFGLFLPWNTTKPLVAQTTGAVLLFADYQGCLWLLGSPGVWEDHGGAPWSWSPPSGAGEEGRDSLAPARRGWKPWGCWPCGIPVGTTFIAGERLGFKQDPAGSGSTACAFCQGFRVRCSQLRAALFELWPVTHFMQATRHEPCASRTLLQVARVCKAGKLDLLFQSVLDLL